MSRPYSEIGYWFNLPFNIDSTSFIDFINNRKQIIMYCDKENDSFQITSNYSILDRDMFDRPSTVKIKNKKFTVCWDVVLPEDLYRQGIGALYNNCVIFTNTDSATRKQSICNTINSIWGVGIWFSHYLDEQPSADIQEKLNCNLQTAIEKIKNNDKSDDKKLKYNIKSTIKFDNI